MVGRTFSERSIIMVSDDRNPYTAPNIPPQIKKKSRREPLKRRIVRYAALGAMAGMGFGFAILARSLRNSSPRRSINPDSFSDYFLSPVLSGLAFAIIGSAVLSIAGASLGFILDIVRPADDPEEENS